MSEHAGQTTFHKKCRGVIRRCSWCGQQIVIGERYGKWLWFDGGSRSTVYAHEECCKAWGDESKKEREVVYADGECERPAKPVEYRFYRHKKLVRTILATKSIDNWRLRGFLVDRCYYLQPPAPDSYFELEDYEEQIEPVVMTRRSDGKELDIPTDPHEARKLIRKYCVKDVNELPKGDMERPQPLEKQCST